MSVIKKQSLLLTKRLPVITACSAFLKNKLTISKATSSIDLFVLCIMWVVRNYAHPTNNVGHSIIVAMILMF